MFSNLQCAFFATGKRGLKKVTNPFIVDLNVTESKNMQFKYTKIDKFVNLNQWKSHMINHFSVRFYERLI